MALPPHIPHAIRMLPHLVECAKAHRKTSVDELARAAAIEIRVAFRPLQFIRDFICVTHSLPTLTVLVERKGPTTSSSSFDPVLFASLSTAEFQSREAEMLERVYAYPNWDRALEGLHRLYGDC